MAKPSKRSSSNRRRATSAASAVSAVSAVSRVSSAALSALSSVSEPPDPKSLERRSEMFGVAIIGAALLFGTALVTFDIADMEAIHAGRGASDDVVNLIGPVGARIADLLLQLVGVGAFALDGLLFLLGVRTLTGRDLVPSVRTVAGGIGATLGSLVLVHLVAHAAALRPLGHDAAGFVGSAIAEFTRAFVSTLGTTLVGLTLLVMSVSALSGRPLVRIALAAAGRRGRRLTQGARNRVAEQVAATRQEWHERRAAKASLKEAEAEAERLQAEAEAEAETERQQAEDADRPLAWAPETGLFHVPDDANAEPVVLPDTRPSRQVPVAQVGTDTPEGFPVGTDIGPAPDIIPTSVRRNTSRADHEQAAAASSPAPGTPAPTGPAPSTLPPAGPAPTSRPRTFDGLTAVDEGPADMPAAAVPPRSAAASQSGIYGLTAEPAASADATAAADGTATRPPAEDTAVRGGAAGRKRASASHDAVLEVTPALPASRASRTAVAAEAPATVDAARAASGAADQIAADGRVPAQTPAPRVPRIVKTAALSEAPPVLPSAEQGSLEIGDRKEWKLPPRYLVQSPPDRKVSAPHHVLVDNARVLEQKLEDFKIKGEVTDIRPGPVVTTYEYKPAAGVKISRIVNLKDDLTMSLSALRVRVVAPIPGRDVVGIEVPNKQRQFVYFREVLESEVYAKSKSNLTLILGKDIEGQPVVTDLAKAPHMLVAGATGTGKSVGINSFLASMLFKATPADVKFIMVDPKVLELSIYEGIPHLLLPPIDDPHQAELALKWAVREMERRYRVLASAKVRNIAGYRSKLPELRENVRKKRVKVVDGKKRLVDANSAGAELLDPPPAPEDMPYIVVVIDEFADLIMASGKEVERAVARLAQKARACGIHVILATQRPSTDVITGMIKANFPTRVSFQVASAIDSKVVLNSVGAESLLGMGDLLFVPPGTSHLKRCHGTWITDDEVASLAEHWKAQGTPNYDMSILEDPEADKPTIEDDAKLDTLFEDAVQVALEAQQASVSFLQRKLGIGYGRAARIIDHMEAKGIVGPQRGPNKPREIILQGGEAGF